MVKVRGFLKPLSQHVFPPLTFSHCFLASAPPHPISIFLLYFLTVSSDGDPRNYQHITFTKSWLLLVMIKRSIPLQATICKFLEIFRAYKYCQPYTIYWVCKYLQIFLSSWVQPNNWKEQNMKYSPTFLQYQKGGILCIFIIRLQCLLFFFVTSYLLVSSPSHIHRIFWKKTGDCIGTLYTKDCIFELWWPHSVNGSDRHI